MSNTTYDVIKNIALLLAPFITLVLSILCAFEIIDNSISVAIAGAFDTFLGAIVVVAKKIYDNKNSEKKNTKNKTK